MRRNHALSSALEVRLPYPACLISRPPPLTPRRVSCKVRGGKTVSAEYQSGLMERIANPLGNLRRFESDLGLWNCSDQVSCLPLVGWTFGGADLRAVSPGSLPLSEWESYF